LPACSKGADDDAIRKQLVGSWSFNPREQLPPEKIDDKAFETPDQVILQIEEAKVLDNGGTSGFYVEYRHIPKLEHSSDHWEAKRGAWFVLDRKVTLQAGRDSAVELKVVNSGSKHLRLDGFALMPCKGGCAFDSLTEIPEAARKAPQRPYP
jgi:hypothetical protein